MCSKKALCIHDISCMGRCSLTVISPVISALGIQCVPLPTTVLSTHFGGFGKPAMIDLTQFCKDSLEHFKSLNFKFDSVYSGYLANYEQMEIVKTAFNLAENGLKICDPVMADHGKLYSSITNDLIIGFKELCSHSDVITPNPTEAQILLDMDFDTTIFKKDEIKSILENLKEKYNSIVITGIKLDDGSMICLGYDKINDLSFEISCNYIPVSFPGTGDLFGACLVGYLTNGLDLKTACEKSAEFVEKCVKTTHQDNTPTKLGVNVEKMLKYLL